MGIFDRKYKNLNELKKEILPILAFIIFFGIIPIAIIFFIIIKYLIK